MSSQINVKKQIIIPRQSKKELTKSVVLTSHCNSTSTTQLSIVSKDSKNNLLKNKLQRFNDENNNTTNNLSNPPLVYIKQKSERKAPKTQRSLNNSKEAVRNNTKHDTIEEASKPLHTMEDETAKRVINSFRAKENKIESFREKEKEKNIEVKNDHVSLNLQNLKINIHHKDDFTREEQKAMETLFVREHHSEDAQISLLEDETITNSCLNKHKINERMRMRMVDWMIEVVNNYKCDDNVFFQAVNLMDDYFDLVGKCLEPNELHLIGVSSMFTCSKYQDIYPLRLKMIYEKIAHKKLSMEEIKQKEGELLRLKDFHIGRPTIWDFIVFFIEEIFINKDNKFHITNSRLNDKVKTYEVKRKSSKILSDPSFNTSKSSSVFKTYTPNMMNLLKHVCIYLAKMNYHDYQLICGKKTSLLAASTIFVALKICEQINKVEYLTDCFIKKLCVLSSKQEQEIIKTAQKILNNAQNFDNIFSGLENLKKVHFNAIIELKNTK